VQWVEPDGRIWAGSHAVGKLLVASGGLWRVLGWLALVPPTRWIASGVYRLIADNRHRLPGGTAACSMPAHLRPGAQDKAA
jgi:predicted DCC family thiol-disulfide oxidoreductase YuxK